MEFYFPLFITRSFSIHSNFLRTGVRGLANFPNEFRSLDGRSGIAAPDVGIRFKAVQKVRDIWHACSQKSSPCSPQSATCTKKTCATLVSGALQPRLRIEIYLPAKTEGHQMAIFISKSKAIENKTTTRLHLSQPFNSQKKGGTTRETCNCCNIVWKIRRHLATFAIRNMSAAKRFEKEVHWYSILPQKGRRIGARMAPVRLLSPASQEPGR